MNCMPSLLSSPDTVAPAVDLDTGRLFRRADHTRWRFRLGLDATGTGTGGGGPHCAFALAGKPPASKHPEWKGVRLFWRSRGGQDGSGQISRNHGTFGSHPVAVPSEERVNPGSRPSAVTPGLDSAAAPDRAKRAATGPSAPRIARNFGDSASLQKSRTRRLRTLADGGGHTRETQ